MLLRLASLRVKVQKLLALYMKINVGLKTGNCEYEYIIFNGKLSQHIHFLYTMQFNYS